MQTLQFTAMDIFQNFEHNKCRRGPWYVSNLEASLRRNTFSLSMGVIVKNPSTCNNNTSPSPSPPTTPCIFNQNTLVFFSCLEIKAQTLSIVKFYPRQLWLFNSLSYHNHIRFMLNDSKALGLLSWTSVGVISVRHTHSPLDQLLVYYSKETKTPSSRATDNDSTIFCHIKNGGIAGEKSNVDSLHQESYLIYTSDQY